MVSIVFYFVFLLSIAHIYNTFDNNIALFIRIRCFICILFRSCFVDRPIANMLCSRISAFETAIVAESAATDDTKAAVLCRIYCGIVTWCLLHDTGKWTFIHYRLLSRSLVVNARLLRAIRQCTEYRCTAYTVTLNDTANCTSKYLFLCFVCIVDSIGSATTGLGFDSDIGILSIAVDMFITCRLLVGRGEC